MSNSKHAEKRSGGKKLRDKWLYLVLILCVAVIGASGYLLLYSGPAADEPLPASQTDLHAADSPISTIPDVSTIILKPADPDEPFIPAPDEGPARETANPVGKKYVLPVSGKTLRGFSNYELIYDETMADWRTHNGVDVACEPGTKVFAMDAGLVEKVYYDELQGGVVEISHADGYYTVYKGLESIPPVTPGDSVAAGDVIGVTASIKTESLLPPHLHWELKKDGVFIDPFSLQYK